MAIKRPKPEEIVVKLRQVEALVGQGMPRIDAIWQTSVTEQTYYRWKKKYGGMSAEQLKELKRLQKENERLCRAVSDLTSDKLILSEAVKGVIAVQELVQWINSGLNGRSPRAAVPASIMCEDKSRFLNVAFAASWASTDPRSAVCHLAC